MDQSYRWQSQWYTQHWQSQWHTWFGRGWHGLLLVASLMLTGCGRGPGADPSLPLAPAPAPNAIPGELLAIDKQQFAEILDKRRSYVVLVDFWATWCPPCMKLLPEVKELDPLTKRGLAIVLVSMDEPEDAGKAAAVLAKHNLQYPAYISRYGVGSAGFEAFGLNELPHLNLYDRQGNLVASFTGANVDEALVRREIERLLEARVPD